jgi:hypothetical protein
MFRVCYARNSSRSTGTGERAVKVNLFVAKDIVKSIAPSFNGDGRLAAVAYKRIVSTVSRFEDEEAKMLARDIVVEMGPQFGGSVDKACDAFERLCTSITEAKQIDSGQ